MEMTGLPAETARFSEVQSFRDNRIAAIAGLGAVIGCGGALFAALGEVGATPATLVAPTILGAVALLLLAGNLRVEVFETHLAIRMFPLTRQHRFSWGEIRRCEARTYRPILEYGGWGVRFSRAGKAYNVYGNRGVQLEFTDGSRLLIGSQHADELADAIRARAPHLA